MILNLLLNTQMICDMDDIYKNIEKYNLNKKREILITFDDMIVDMVSNKKLNPIVTEIFIIGRKLNISLTQSHFFIPKNVRLNSTQYFIMTIFKKTRVSTNRIWSFIRYWF